jgi:predicted RNA-binding protein with PUA-like domain
MTWYLLKTEPDDYAYADLVRTKRDAWTDVANPAAQLHMRAMRKGDTVFIYHTGSQRAIAGVAKVVRGAYPDPDHPGVTAKGDPKRVLVDLAPHTQADTPLTLAEMKADPAFADFVLVKQARLSAMPVPDELAAIMLQRIGVRMERDGA